MSSITSNIAEDPANHARQRYDRYVVSLAIVFAKDDN